MALLAPDGSTVLRDKTSCLTYPLCLLLSVLLCGEGRTSRQFLKREPRREREKLPSLASAESLLEVPRSQTAGMACWPGICVLSQLLFCWFVVACFNDVATNALCRVSGLPPS